MALRYRFGGLLALLAATIVGAAAQVPLSRGVEAVAANRMSGEWRSSGSAVIAPGPGMLAGGADLGPAPAAARLERVLLLLEPSAEQRQALDAELANQQDATSPEYHRWLTPSQFAERYANSASDVAAVGSWLESEGFAVAPLPAGRGWIEFSGTVGQLERAFQTGVHTVSTGSGERRAVAGGVSVPAALKPLIHGLVSLDGAVTEPAITRAQTVVSAVADFQKAASPAQGEALTPQLVAQQLHLETSGATGAGEAVAIVGRSNVQEQDVAAFRALFGLPANPVHVVLDRSDPGRTADEAEAVLLASWAGAMAPQAQIVLVSSATTAATDGVDLSLARIVDKVAAHTVVVGYSACEPALSEAHRAFYGALYRQAAAQGMSVIVAAGDSGAAACHAAGSNAAVTTGLAVNGLAATPWNTAAGAVAFSPSGTGQLAAWSPVDPADAAYASGGGLSITARAPGWQTVMMPNASGRMLPDVVLPTALDSGASRGLAFCFSGAAQAVSGCRLVRAGGSSAAAAIFGGISALLAEKFGAQGNLAPRLYALEGQAGVFTDVQQGSTRLTCAAGSPDCDGSGHLGYDAAAGYDLATGLGLPNAEKLVNAWPAATGTGAASVALSVSPLQANTTYNPTAAITLSAVVSSQTGGPVPTGTLNFIDQTTGNSVGSTAITLDASGKASVTQSVWSPIGGHNIVGRYNGDSTYAAVTSQVLTINIQPSTTTPTVTPSTTTPIVGASFTVAVTVAVGTPPAGTVAPTGNVTLTVDGAPKATAALSTSGGTTSASFTASVASAGGHNLQAIYAGDTNYGASTSPSVSVNASKGATVTTLTATPATLTAGTAESFTATIAAENPVAGQTNTFTGTVTFFDGTAQLGTAPVSANGATLSNAMLSSAATHVITAVYSGDGNWAGSTSNAVTLKAVLLPVTVTLVATPATAGPGQVISLTATVTPSVAPASTVEQNPTGNVIFYNGTTVIGTVTLSASLNFSSTATLITGNLPSGTDVVTAYYVGDQFYSAATSNQVTLSVQDFSIAPAPSNSPADLDIIKGSSGQASFIVSALGGFATEMQVVCTVPTQADMTCTPSPVFVTPTATITFTVQTFAAGGISTSSSHAAPLWPRALGGTALAGLVFLVLPLGRKARVFAGRVRGVMVIALLLIGLGGAGIGCSNSVTAPVNNGTPLGMTTLTITGAAYVDNTVISHSVYLAVNVLPSNSTGTAVPARGSRRK